MLASRFIGRDNLIPSLDTVLAHENKGMMGILAAERGLPYIKQDYCISHRNESKQELSYPFVYKALGGAGSKGVSLVHNKKDHSRSIGRSLFADLSIREFKEGVKNTVRKLLNRKAQAEYLAQQARYCAQEFVPGLQSDFKVLVFWDKVYVLKRSVREGDFRASGSGKFEIQNEIDPVLAELAIECRAKLCSPFCSLDFVTLCSGEYKLIEFQTCHFGPYTYLNAYCYRIKSELVEVSKNISFDKELALSLVNYLNENSV
ncbi:hypothetical protein [Thaumasiovibrio subtropicus]|uniref:hypothetical protein n=1 Tax=Thaumasiovibrio subtropicus TaxID=1891207 RepID=UPI001C84BDCD|nr:hypothetical protein [Thaumasiovibrio subtropicus]